MEYRKITAITTAGALLGGCSFLEQETFDIGIECGDANHEVEAYLSESKNLGSLSVAFTCEDWSSFEVEEPKSVELIDDSDSREFTHKVEITSYDVPILKFQIDGNKVDLPGSITNLQLDS